MIENRTGVQLTACSCAAWLMPVLVLALMLAFTACDSGDGRSDDAELDARASEPDAVIPGAFAACASDGQCEEGLYCDEEIPSEADLPGAPSGVLSLPLFPGGSCSPRSLSPYGPSSCDPTAERGEQGCTSAGVCVPEAFGERTLVACRASCEPSASDSGCARDGYTCDFNYRACLEGCGSDEECRLLLLDSNGDDVLDAVRYDEDSSAFCDPETFRCSHPGAGPDTTGGACARLDDCAPDGTCVRSTTTIGGHAFPRGHCTKFGCDVPGRACDGEQGVCEGLRPWSGSSASSLMCLSRCEVGSEPEADRLGPGGHGAGCRPGYRCHYNGGEGAASGVCVGGVYNDVAEANVGAACTRDGQCYSPFGYGRCIPLAVGDVVAPTGVCTIMDCDAPGLPGDLCGAGGACIPLRAGLTFCVQRCEAADECAEGFACADDDADPSTDRICYPACTASTECRAGEGCRLATGAGYGQCVASAGQGG